MKKVLLLILFVLGIVKVQAQVLEEGLDLPTIMPEISADEESKNWQRTLLLNEGQYIKVKEINKERRETIASVKAMYPHEPEKRDQKVQEVEVQYDSEFAAVLTNKQMKEYLELHGRSEDTPVKVIASDGKSFNSQLHNFIQDAMTHKADSVQLTEHTLHLGDSLAPAAKPIIKTLQSMYTSEPGIKGEMEKSPDSLKMEGIETKLKKED